MASEQLVVFQLGSEEYGVSIGQVKEIIRYSGATRLPKTPDYMEGIINLRGQIIPVVDLARRFRLTNDSGGAKQAVIVEAAGREIGMVVDEVREVLWIGEAAYEPATMVKGDQPFIRGIGKVEGRLVIILDLERVFAAEELSELAAAS